ncbi:hypothetical protein [Cyanobacterium sp. Dongsha4]|uniref:hypothetical protein n=1 Tax=Cyanobacterium sp. DS4 TaxID=2878255 RepID=UPI002E816707|nr:hypothetical protein [Cyanobacterium sp. Dongsha4]WVL01149.1 hypothetical protein Dongsha4_02855 [Cyanobacterium sp. Dongsha4]
MERKKIVAIVTGIVSVLLGVVYLILVELLDSRGAMIPAPVNDVSLLLSWLFSPHFYL